MEGEESIAAGETNCFISITLYKLNNLLNKNNLSEQDFSLLMSIFEQIKSFEEKLTKEN